MSISMFDFFFPVSILGVKMSNPTPPRGDLFPLRGDLDPLLVLFNVLLGVLGVNAPFPRLDFDGVVVCSSLLSSFLNPKKRFPNITDIFLDVIFFLKKRFLN
jgi:hypothetical protein